MRTRTVAALLAAVVLIAAAPGFAQPAAPDAAGLMKAGKATFEGTCKLCHTLDIPLSRIKDTTGWEATVIHMVGNGAKINEAEKGQIVAFLSAKSLFETKCSLCHSVSLPLGKTKPAAGWAATVQKMAEKKPGHLSAQEIATIVTYLALERPAP